MRVRVLLFALLPGLLAAQSLQDFEKKVTRFTLANGMTFLVSFLPYASSAFVPIHTMPGWLQGFARNQPVTAVVDALRAFLSGQPAATSAWHALAWSAAIIALSVAAAGVLFRRRAR